MTRQPCGSDVRGARGKHKSRTLLLRANYSRLPNSMMGLGIALAVVVVAAMGLDWWGGDPLANGAIPAQKHEPDEHWDALQNWPSMIRDFSFHIRSPSQTFQEKVHDMDFGGTDGHTPEGIDMKGSAARRVIVAASFARARVRPSTHVPFLSSTLPPRKIWRAST